MRLATIVSFALLMPGGSAAAPDGWTPCEGGPFGGHVAAVAVDPGAPEVMLVGTWNGANGGIYRSTDGGESWTISAIGIPISLGYGVNALSFAPAARDGQGALAGTALIGGNRVFRSADGGETWTTALTGLSQVRDITYVDGDTVYVVSNSALHRSTNGGTTWLEMSTGLPSTGLWCVRIDPRLHRKIFVGTDSGLYLSDDGGEHWSPTPFTDRVRDVAIDTINPDTLFIASLVAGVFKVYDDGAGWTLLGEEGEYSNEIEIDPLDPNRLIIAGWVDSGIRWSDDRGETWQAWGRDDLTDVDIYSLVAFERPGCVTGIVAGSGHVGFHRYDPDLDRWEPSSSGIAEMFIVELAAFEADRSILYACVDRMSPLRSDDGGFSWTMHPGNDAWGRRLDTDGISPGIAIHPTDPDVVYFSTESPFALFKTLDGGVTWTPLEEGLHPIGEYGRVRGIAINPQHPDTVYVSSNQGVFKSTDGGASWEQKNDGMTLTWLWKVAVDPVNTETIYSTSVSPTYVYKSIDGAESWTNMSDGITGITEGTSIVIDRDSPQTLYLALCGFETDPTRGTVYRSDDGAGSWTELREGLPPIIVRPKVRIDDVGERIWVTTPTTGDGVYYRDLGGDLWQSAGGDLPDAWCTALEPGRHGIAGSAMFLGRRGGSCLYWPAVPVAVEMDDAGGGERRPHGPLALHVTPNPSFGSGVTIGWNLRRPDVIEITVFDTRGRRVRSFGKAPARAGRATITWDRRDDAGHDVAAGAYWVCVASRGGMESGRVLLIR